LGPFLDRIKEKSLILEGETVGDVIKKFLINYGNNLKEFLNPEKKESFISSVGIFLNGKNVEFLEGFNTLLGKGDTIAFVVVAAGG